MKIRSRAKVRILFNLPDSSTGRASLQAFIVPQTKIVQKDEEFFSFLLYTVGNDNRSQQIKEH